MPQHLSVAVAALLKSTEPCIEQYFAIHVPKALTAAGFGELQIAAEDPRHRVITSRRPMTLAPEGPSA